MTRPAIGLVHVRVEAAGRCYPGIIMVPGLVVSRVRVLHPSQGHDVGGNDEEGDMREHPVIVPNPDGTERTLDHWHHPDHCTFE